MADTKRTLAALTALLADNTAGDISAQDLRDLLVSVYGSRMVNNVTGNTTLTTDYDVVTADASGGAVTITLPDRATVQGKVYTIKRTSASNNVVVSRAGSDTIEGATSKTLGSQYATITLLAGTATWLILSSTGTVT